MKKIIINKQNKIHSLVQHFIIFLAIELIIILLGILFFNILGMEIFSNIWKFIVFIEGLTPLFVLSTYKYFIEYKK